MRLGVALLLLVLPFTCFANGASRVQTPYAEQKVVYDFTAVPLKKYTIVYK